MKIQNRLRLSARSNFLSLSALVFSAFALSSAAHGAPDGTASNQRSIGMPNIGTPNVGASRGSGQRNERPRNDSPRNETPRSGRPDNSSGRDSSGRDAGRDSRTRVSVNINLGGGLNTSQSSTQYFGGAPIIVGSSYGYPGYGYPNSGYGGGNVVVIGNGTTVYSNSNGYDYNYPYVYVTQPPQVINIGPTLVHAYRNAPNYAYYPTYPNSYSYNTTNYNSLPASAYYFDPRVGSGTLNDYAAYWNLPADSAYYGNGYSDLGYYDPNSSYSSYSTTSATPNAQRRLGAQRGIGNSTTGNGANGASANGAKNTINGAPLAQAVNNTQWADGAVWSANADGTPATIPTWPSDATATSAAK